MKRTRHLIAIFSAALWLAEAIPVSPLDVPYLVQTSNVIVVGEILSVVRNGRGTVEVGGQAFPGEERIAELRVSRVIKGMELIEQLGITFYFPDEPAAFQDIRLRETGIFFLREEEGHYLVTDPHYVRITATRQCVASASEALDRVTAELRCTLSDVSASESSQVDAAQALDSIRTAPATDALKLAADSPRTAVRLRAIAALLNRNDISRVASVETLLLQPVTESMRSSVDRIASAIWLGVRDPDAIPVLEKLLQSPDFRVRRGAAQALRNTGSTMAISGLAEALNDGERDVRYIAVIGLGEITKQNTWSPSIDNFYQNEWRFLTYWRSWVKSSHGLDDHQ